jgi:hypothetical protein
VSELQAKLERLLDEHVKDMACADHGVVPVVSDYLLVVALDDAADDAGGGMYISTRKHAPLYRTVGLLHEADLIMHQRKPDPD